MNAAPTLSDAVALAAQVGARLRHHKMTCATAESCTGGLIGHLITEVPGSSDYFAGGAVVYSYAAKEAVIGVDHATLLAEGAVSAPVAAQMAQGARRVYGADIAVAVTGIAGPGGGLPGKPSGTVFLHVSAAGGYEHGERHVWQGNRSSNKLLSAVRGLQMIEEYLRTLDAPEGA